MNIHKLSIRIKNVLSDLLLSVTTTSNMYAELEYLEIFVQMTTNIEIYLTSYSTRSKYPQIDQPWFVWRAHHLYSSTGLYDRTMT